MSDIIFDIIHGTDDVAEGFQKCNKNFLKVNDTVSKSDVVNNLTTSEEGKVLDARQGKELAKQIGVLSEDRGYVNVKTITSDVYEEIKASGKYRSFANVKNTPDSTSAYNYDAIIQDNFGFMICGCVSGQSRGTIWYNIMDNNEWLGWEGITNSKKLQEGLNLKLNQRGDVNASTNLVNPEQFAWLPYNYGNGNFCGIGCGADGALNFRIGTQEQFKTTVKIFGGETVTINDKRVATTDKIDILFTGSSKNGDVTLSNAYTNYNYLILAFGYDAEQVTQVINIYNASNPVKTKLVNGIRRIYPFNGATNIGLGNGTTLNMFSLDSKVILLGVYGVLIGG